MVVDRRQNSRPPIVKSVADQLAPFQRINKHEHGILGSKTVRRQAKGPRNLR